jgi:hypothetical protein
VRAGGGSWLAGSLAGWLAGCCRCCRSAAPLRAGSAAGRNARRGKARRRPAPQACTHRDALCQREQLPPQLRESGHAGHGENAEPIGAVRLRREAAGFEMPRRHPAPGRARGAGGRATWAAACACSMRRDPEKERRPEPPAPPPSRRGRAATRPWRGPPGRRTRCTPAPHPSRRASGIARCAGGGWASAKARASARRVRGRRCARLWLGRQQTNPRGKITARGGLQRRSAGHPRHHRPLEEDAAG